MLSYEPLWMLLISKKLKKIDLVKNKIVAPSTLAKLSKDLPVNSQIYDRLCNFLDCNIEDIVKHVK